MNRDKDLIAATDVQLPLAGLSGYTHKDPERVYKLSRVSLRAQDSAIQKPDQPEITCLTVYIITPMH